MEQVEIETLFEQYLKQKASTRGGALWLDNYKRGGLNTLILVMHFIYDEKGLNANVEPLHEDELFHQLYKVKNRVFRELFN